VRDLAEQFQRGMRGTSNPIGAYIKRSLAERLLDDSVGSPPEHLIGFNTECAPGAVRRQRFGHGRRPSERGVDGYQDGNFGATNPIRDSLGRREVASAQRRFLDLDALIVEKPTRETDFRVDSRAVDPDDLNSHTGLQACTIPRNTTSLGRARDSIFRKGLNPITIQWRSLSVHRPLDPRIRHR
jgi:hypothetical protein